MSDHIDQAEFLSAALDTLSMQIAVIDAAANIVWINDAWKRFHRDNGGSADYEWVGTNYLAGCGAGDVEKQSTASEVKAGIHKVLEEAIPAFECEYPCHSPMQLRWFMMRISQMTSCGPRLFVVSHHDITARKMAEEKLREQAVIDSVTGIFNRRHFDDAFHLEWRHAMRHQRSLSLMLVDIDFFKQLNDEFGHAAGDDCLRQVAWLLRKFAQRPGDIAARFGGDEFALLLSNAPAKAALELAAALQANLRALDIRSATTAIEGRVTASIGVSVMPPGIKVPKLDLIKAADYALYEAKRLGRNRIMHALQ